MRYIALLFVFLCYSGVSFAEWRIATEASAVNFTSVKNQDFAENHSVATLSGVLADDGGFRFQLDLNSLDSKIPIRNDRMKEHLFETHKYQLAIIQGKMDENWESGLPAGESHAQVMPFLLTLHGVEKSMQANVRITRVADDQLLVHTLEPVLVSAGTFGLDGGIEKLRELAGLANISKTVPVSFSLTLRDHE